MTFRAVAARSALALSCMLIAATPAAAQFWQCAPYARTISGVDIHGNANTWWGQAAGRYERGQTPKEGAVLAFESTRRMRLGHGICVMPPRINHPARVAERIATLDLLSNGRVEWGTGESGTAMELEGFGVDPDLKKDMWREATEQCANMMTMTPYPGFQGEHFSMPTRNVCGP